MRKLIVVSCCLAAFAGVTVVHAARTIAPVTSTTVQVQSLGALPGDNQSMGFGVDDLGSVVGASFGAGGQRAFYWNATGMYQLTAAGSTGAAYAIAGGKGGPEYAVGFETSAAAGQRAVIWISPPSGTMQFLETGGSMALGVNDAGTAVGSSGGVPTIWSPSGNLYQRTYIPLGTGDDDAYAVDINNAGIVIVNVYRQVTYLMHSFVWLPVGTKVALPRAGNDVETNVQAVSEVFGTGNSQSVYVVGESRADGNSGRSVRWTVNIVSGTVSEVRVLNQAWSEGVNSAGDVAGTVNAAGKQSASLWRGSAGTYTELKPPKGGTGGTSRGMARTATSPTFVVGQTTINNWPRAVRWEVK